MPAAVTFFHFFLQHFTYQSLIFNVLMSYSIPMHIFSKVYLCFSDVVESSLLLFWLPLLMFVPLCLLAIPDEYLYFLHYFNLLVLQFLCFFYPFLIHLLVFLTQVLFSLLFFDCIIFIVSLIVLFLNIILIVSKTQFPFCILLIHLFFSVFHTVTLRWFWVNVEFVHYLKAFVCSFIFVSISMNLFMHSFISSLSFCASLFRHSITRISCSIILAIIVKSEALKDVTLKYDIFSLGPGKMWAMA